MEKPCQLISIFRYPLGCSFLRCAINEHMVVFHFLDKVQFTFFRQFRKVCLFPVAPLYARFFCLGKKAVDTGIGILDIVNGVVAGLLFRQVNIEVHLAVQCAAAEEIPRRIASHFVHQFTERDRLPCALGHFHRLPVTKKCHHLEKHDFKIFRIVAEELHGRMDTDDVSVVICAPYVNQLIVAPFFLIRHIGDIGTEIGRFAAGADDDPVLVITVLRRGKPPGAVFLIQISALFQRIEGVIHLLGVKRFFREPVVKSDMEISQILFQDRQFFTKRYRFEYLQARLFIHGQIRIAFTVNEGLGCFHDVIPMVTVVRHIHVFSEKLEVAGIYRFCQVGNLAARVIHIVLGIHIISCRTEQVHQGGTVSRAAGVPDMERSCRIGRHIFHKDLVLFIFRKISVRSAGGKDIS